jgi:hypothetical protein
MANYLDNRDAIRLDRVKQPRRKNLAQRHYVGLGEA